MGSNPAPAADDHQGSMGFALPYHDRRRCRWLHQATATVFGTPAPLPARAYSTSKTEKSTHLKCRHVLPPTITRHKNCRSQAPRKSAQRDTSSFDGLVCRRVPGRLGEQVVFHCGCIGGEKPHRFAGVGISACHSSLSRKQAITARNSADIRTALFCGSTQG